MKNVAILNDYNEDGINQMFKVVGDAPADWIALSYSRHDLGCVDLNPAQSKSTFNSIELEYLGEYIYAPPIYFGLPE